MSSPRWIFSIRLSASLFWWPTRHRDGPDSRCWRPSVSSPKSNLYRPVRPMTRAAHTPATSRVGSRMSWRCGTGRANGKPTNGSAVELANLRGAFRWAADNDDLDTAAAIANSAQGSSAFGSNSMNPSVGPRSSSIARGPSTTGGCHSSTSMAAMCYATGRVGDSSDMPQPARLAIESGRFDEVPYEFEVALSATYATAGEPDQWVELCRNIIARETGRPCPRPGIPGHGTDVRRPCGRGGGDAGRLAYRCRCHRQSRRARVCASWHAALLTATSTAPPRTTRIAGA